MKLSLAIACLLAPQGQAVSVKNKLMSKSQFPTLPSAQSIVNVVTGGLDMVAKELPRELHSVETWCPDGKHGKGGKGQECETYERGLRRDISRANRDVVRGFEEIGIDMSNNVIDPKFITDLIEAEYGDFVKQWKAHAAETVQGLQYGLNQVAEMGAASGLAETTTKTTQPEIAGFTDCDQIRWGGRCDGPGECPGPCCWRGPENAAEEASFMKYEQDRDAKAEQCYLSSNFVQDVLGGAPPQVTEQMAKQLVGEVKKQSGEAGNVEHLAGALTGINAVLQGEATRLGMEAPKLPDPTDTASKIMQALSKVSGMAENHIDEVVRELNRARADMIREVWKVERDIVYTLGFSPFDQAATQAALTNIQKEVASGNVDRDFEQTAGVINQMGGNSSKDEVKKFVADTLDTMVKVASAPDFQNQEKHLIQSAEHEAARTARRQIKA